MSRLYPTLEDMAVDKMQQAQMHANQAYQEQAAAHAQAALQDGSAQVVPPAYGTVATAAPSAVLYPSLDDFMGLVFTDPEVQRNLVAIPQMQQQVAVATVPGAGGMVAPLSGGSVGLQRAEVTHGIREVVLCKDAKGLVGLRVRAVNKGVFVSLVHAGTPAALAGLRFGDQILQLNGQNCAGWDTDKAMGAFKKAGGERIALAVRDRPFERTITMHKDSTNHIGFVVKNGKITAITKDSSAARNGVLTEHNLLEVNGQNVVGMKDKEISRAIDVGERSVTITIMPSFLYEHMMKCISSSLVSKVMDHSIPDV
ncbi:PREDICTED: syntenin-1-like [Priapulus caudatus]|uniref:Syntenin-1-like n=1 Tax=Priapulus caudatus TaxID=37621 RepID=A0ABM1DRD6_PRICU|nr:PREDICTED: syntenin-1-like [Priapulus caudatus]